MAQEITMSDILEMEAYGQSIVDKARRMKQKLLGKEKAKKGRGLGEKQLADLVAHREKTILRARLRMEANKKAGL